MKTRLMKYSFEHLWVFFLVFASYLIYFSSKNVY